MPQQNLFSAREETMLLLVGIGLFIIIIIAYLWGVTVLGAGLRDAVAGSGTEAVVAPEFKIKEAEAILRAKGLIQ